MYYCSFRGTQVKITCLRIEYGTFNVCIIHSLPVHMLACTGTYRYVKCRKNNSFGPSFKKGRRKMRRKNQSIIEEGQRKSAITKVSVFGVNIFLSCPPFSDTNYGISRACKKVSGKFHPFLHRTVLELEPPEA